MKRVREIVVNSRQFTDEDSSNLGEVTFQDAASLTTLAFVNCEDNAVEPVANFTCNLQFIDNSH